MIYITGDTHIPIDIGKLTTKRFPEQKHLTKNDYLIICGDFGGIWDGSNQDRYWLDWLENKKFTTLFVDGNHENFDLLSKYPVENWNGGKVQKIRNSVIHLMRGQIYNIDGRSFFTMGGASSHDKEYRAESKSWWSSELPSNEEYEESQRNLDLHNNSVDYIITHCAPDSIQKQIAWWYEHDKLTNFLESVKSTVEYKMWFFGHYHLDGALDNKHFVVYEDIIELA